MRYDAQYRKPCSCRSASASLIESANRTVGGLPLQRKTTNVTRASVSVEKNSQNVTDEVLDDLSLRPACRRAKLPAPSHGARDGTVPLPRSKRDKIH